jgi:hypothetical protein
LRAIHSEPTSTPIDTTATDKVATAFTVGFRPSRARAKITMGSVLTPGPFRNELLTTSSSEIVKVRSQAEMSACAINGRVTSTKTWNGRQPRSMAASSRALSMVKSRD